MKIVNFEQGSEEWLAWRRGGLGGSDASVILDGLSPYGSRRDLFERKRGLRPEPKENPGHRYGKLNEPKAREAYIQITGTVVTPICGESEEHPFLRRSYDGLSLDMTRAIEIKSTNAKDHATALAGRVPAKYLPEIHHGHLVSPQIEQTDYVSFRPGSETAIVPVRPDRIFMDRLLREETAFWNAVLTGELPVDTDLNMLLTRLRVCMIDQQQAKIEEATIRQEILAVIPPEAKRIQQAGVLVTRKDLGAGVRYEHLVDSLQVPSEELERFRKVGAIDLERVIARFGEEMFRDCRHKGEIDFEALVAARGLSKEEVNKFYFPGEKSYQFRLKESVPEAEAEQDGAVFVDEAEELLKTAESFNFIA